MITVDVVSDVACPWCYVGKKNLEAALKQWNGAPVEVQWHPFQLDPSIPEEGLDGPAYLANKFGGSERIKGMTDRLTQIGQNAGIKFDFEADWLAINTLPLHSLLHAAKQEGFQNVLKERLFKAYFEERLPMNDSSVLERIMAEFGWNTEKVSKVLNADELAYEVRSEIAYYQQKGVSGVPFFIINNKYGINGAQPSEVFLEVFEKVSEPLEIISGDSCDPETGEC